MNNKDADQTVQSVHPPSLICTFVVQIGIKKFFHDESHHEKTGFLQMRKQKRSSAVR